jgi:hypothetical protein
LPSPLTSGGGLLSGVKLKKEDQKLTLGSKVGLPLQSSHTPRRPQTPACSQGDDLIQDLFGQRLAIREAGDDRVAVAAGEPCERQLGDVGMAAPGWHELGPEGHQDQDRQALHPLDQQTQRFQGGWIDPVRVFIQGEHRLPRREALDLIDQEFERPLCLALRAQVGRRVAFAGRNADHVGDQRHGLG